MVLRRQLFIRALAFALAASAVACSARQLGFPRTPVSATSPDDTHIAVVRNHPDIDPPSQSIWVGPRDGIARRIAQLAPDLDWCNMIVWSPDSSTVAFLIQDVRLITVDAATQIVISDKSLTAWRGEYPPDQMAVDLTLDARGTEARFRVCDRKMFRAGYVFDAANCGEFRRVDLREPGKTERN